MAVPIAIQHAYNTIPTDSEHSMTSSIVSLLNSNRTLFEGPFPESVLYRSIMTMIYSKCGKRVATLFVLLDPQIISNIANIDEIHIWESNPSISGKSDSINKIWRKKGFVVGQIALSLLGQRKRKPDEEMERSSRPYRITTSTITHYLCEEEDAQGGCQA
ncbi:MAG: hypothetical protein Q9227_001691 [Pyrenula ochraceoflavens]